MTFPLLHTDVVPHVHESGLPPSAMAAIAVAAVVFAIVGTIILRRAKK